MGKTRDLFKKIRDTKGTFHAKMSSIKDRNGMDLTEAEDIKKRWQEYTAAAAAAKSLQSCLTLCDPIDGSPPGFPVPGILQARILEWVALSHSVVFLYFFSLIPEEGFLISSCYSLELCIQMFISFLFSFAFRFSSFHSYL